MLLLLKNNVPGGYTECLQRRRGTLLARMIRRAFPVRFNRAAENGRTRPLRITVLTDDDIEHDIFLKPSQGIELGVEALANEALGALVAGDLGLPINEPFFVDLDPDFVGSIADVAIRQRLQSSCPVAFGSKDAGRQWRRWNEPDRVANFQCDAALAVLAFDAFIGNNDRSPKNPNLLVRDAEWRLIDHEAAFSFRMKLFPRCEPWKVGNLNMLSQRGADAEHVFAPHLAGRGGMDFAAVQDQWSDLSDERLAYYSAVLPDEWAAIRGHYDAAIDHLRGVRETIEPCLSELRRLLS